MVADIDVAGVIGQLKALVAVARECRAGGVVRHSQRGPRIEHFIA